MKYYIQEGNVNSIKWLNFNSEVNICVDDFNNFINKNFDELIEYFIKTDKIIDLLRLSDKTFSSLVNTVINDGDIEELFDSIVEEKKPLFSIFYSIVKKYKRDYKLLCDIKNGNCICISVNKDNFIKSLDFAKKFNCPIILSGTNISLLEYNNFFENIDINEYNNYNIKVFYQEQNSSLSLDELYETSNHVSKIVSDVKKYNLSPIEQIMYVYDFVKSREYKKEENEDALVSRDLNRILTGEKIVCVGYSNLFTAILRCLNINSMSLISTKKKHQSNMVYIDDKKYNINGVYAFDATGDSKKNRFYIDNYNYFALPLDTYNKEIPFDLFKYMTMSFEELYNIFDYNRFSNDDNHKLYFLSSLFELINSNELDDDIFYYSNKELETKVFNIYSTILSKFYKDDIDVDKFFQILYNVRRIEYYTGVNDELDIENIKSATVHREVIKKKKELRCVKDINATRMFLEMITLDENLMNTFEEKEDDIISSSLSYDVNLNRDIANINLLKTLNKIKNLRKPNV